PLYQVPPAKYGSATTIFFAVTPTGFPVDSPSWCPRTADPATPSATRQSARGGNADPKRAQLLTDPPGQGHGARGVAMYAQGSKRYGNPAAVAGDNFTIRDQRADLPCHRIWIGEDGTRFGSRQQRAIH